MLVVSEFLHVSATFVIARRSLDIHRTARAVGYFAAIDGIGTHINVIISRQSEVDAQTVESVAPASILAVIAVNAIEPLIVFAHHHIARRIGAVSRIGDHLFEPRASSLEALGGAHILAVEHHKHHFAVAEMIANALLAQIAVFGIIVGLTEEIVACSHKSASHIIVIAIYARPHIIGEMALGIEALPKRETAAPSSDVAQMEHPLERAEPAHCVNHSHGIDLTMHKRRIGVKIRDYAASPTFSAGGDERMHLRSRRTLFVDNHIFISRVGRKPLERGSALDDGRIFVDVAIVGGFGIDAVEGYAAKFGLRAQPLGILPIGIRRRAIDDCRAFAVGSPTDAHSGRRIFARASDDGAYILSYSHLCG